MRLAALFAIVTAAAGEDLELRGRIEPAPGKALVSIHGAATPFSDSALSDGKGRFRFSKLAPGAYTVSVFVPGAGESRRTVEVSPALADGEGRVAVTIPFEPSGSAAALERRHSVSVRQLSIPDRARREYEEAQKKLRRRDVEGAVKHMRRAVEMAPAFMVAWNHLGTIAYQSGEFPEAERCFRTALEQEPGAFEPLVNLGGVLINLGRLEEALPYNRYAVRDRPGDALAQSQLGMNHFFLGELDPAEKHLSEAKRLDPAHFSYPQLILAEIYRRRSRGEAAMRELEDFLARHPDSPRAEEARRKIEALRRTPQ